MTVLKQPIIPALPTKPARAQSMTLEQRVKYLEEYTDRLNTWAVAISRSLTAYTKQLNDLFNRGSVKRLDQ